MDVSVCHGFVLAELLAVVAANAGSLRTLRRVNAPKLDHLRAADVDALIAAAPLLEVLEASVACSWMDAPRLMRAEPPLTPLRLSLLSVARCPNIPTHTVRCDPIGSVW